MSKRTCGNFDRTNFTNNQCFHMSTVAPERQLKSFNPTETELGFRVWSVGGQTYEGHERVEVRAPEVLAMLLCPVHHVLPLSKESTGV